MTILGFILFIAGLIISFIYGIILIVKAFQASIVWGLIYLFVPFGAFIFICTNWDEAGKPFLMDLLGFGMMIGGLLLMPGAAG